MQKEASLDKEAIIVFEDVSIGYERHPILHDINLSIKRGGFVGLLGPNGSGKTTLFKTILRIIPPLSGRIVYSGGVPPRFGYVPQRETLDSIFPLRTKEIVLMGTFGHGRAFSFIPRTEREWAMHCLEKVGLQDMARKPYSELSGGQKQRALIARALTSRPDFLLLDEPTAGVDVTAEKAILATISTIRQELQLTVMMVSHHLHSMRELASQIIWIHEGKAFSGGVDEMLSSSKIEQVFGV